MNPKDLRKQLKNLLNDADNELPISVITAEIERRVMLEVTKRLDAIEQRSKDVASYVLRNSVQNLPVQPEKASEK